MVNVVKNIYIFKYNEITYSYIPCFKRGPSHSLYQCRYPFKKKHYLYENLTRSLLNIVALRLFDELIIELMMFPLKGSVLIDIYL